MNDGYWFFIIGFMLMAFMMTGWLDGLWKNDSYKKNRNLLVLLVIMMIGMGFFISIHPQWFINFTSVIFLTAVFMFYMWKDGSVYCLQILSAVMFLGLFYALAYQMFAIDPILMIIPPVWIIALIFTLIISLTTQTLRHQWLMMLGGLLLGECLHKATLLQYMDQVVIGDAAFHDQLMIGFTMMTSVYFFIRKTVQGYQQLSKWMLPHRKEEGS